MATQIGGATSSAQCRWRGSLLVAVAAATMLVGCTTESSPAVPGDDVELVQGRQLYITQCVSCHGGSGGGGRGAKLNNGWVVDRYPEVADEVAVVTDGVRAMPGFESKLTVEEIEAVVRYTREIIDPISS